MTVVNTFEREFRDMMNRVQIKAIDRGLARAGLMVLRDAIIDVNMVPVDEGTLRGSGSVFVGRVLKHTSAELGFAPMDGGEPATINDDVPSGEHSATIGLNTDYAAHLHEHPEYNFTHDGAGGKYLEAKLSTNRDTYFGEVVDSIKEELGA